MTRTRAELEPPIWVTVVAPRRYVSPEERLDQAINAAPVTHRRLVQKRLRHELIRRRKKLNVLHRRLRQAVKTLRLEERMQEEKRRRLQEAIARTMGWQDERWQDERRREEEQRRREEEQQRAALRQRREEEQRGTWPAWKSGIDL